MFAIKWTNVKNNRSGQLDLDGRNPFETAQTAEEWFLAQNHFGKHERWTDILACSEEEIESKLDERTISLGDDISRTEILLPAEYTYEIVDLANDYDYQLQECYEKRKLEYGSIEDQLDEIYHNLTIWRARIKKIKEKHPKPVKE